MKTLGYVDPDRIGVWGLSYGGFMTLQAVTRDPQLFRCAINVAGVTDWATYGVTNGNGFGNQRMGSVVTNPEGFERRGAPHRPFRRTRHRRSQRFPQRRSTPIRSINDIVISLAVLDGLQPMGPVATSLRPRMNRRAPRPLNLVSILSPAPFSSTPMLPSCRQSLRSLPTSGSSSTTSTAKSLTSATSPSAKPNSRKASMPGTPQ